MTESLNGQLGYNGPIQQQGWTEGFEKSISCQK